MPKYSIGWFIGLTACSLIFFICYFIFSNINYQRRFSDKYDIRNHFPYEYNFESKLKDNLFGNIALILSTVFSLGLFGLTLVYFKNNGYLLFVVIAGMLYSLIILFINFVPLKLLRFHMIISVLSFVIAFVTPCALGLTSFSNFQETKNPASMALMIISIVIALFFFGLTMNPRLTLKIQMIVTTDDKGNEKYVRPKYIILAFTEWMMSFGILPCQILLVVLLLTLS